MENIVLKSMSPQSVKIYDLLLSHKTLSAKEIGTKIGIVPNTAYRNLNELVALGFVELVDSYPIKYRARSSAETISSYTSLIQKNFLETFGFGTNRQADDGLNIKFFQTRKDFLNLSAKDMGLAKTKINIIVSGHELPAETVLVHKLAADRGIKIRKLVQSLNDESRRMAKNWKKMGIEIRYTPNLNARILIIDGQITYFGSYSPDRQPEASGVRFDYPPYAKIMDELFEQKWEQAKIIS